MSLITPMFGDVDSLSSSSKMIDFQSVDATRRREISGVMSQNPRKWAEVNTSSEQLEEAAKLAFEIEEMNATLITEDKLRRLTGQRELENVNKLEMVVDSEKSSSLEMLGVLLPQLQQLYLDGSKLASLRDLGTDLRRLQTLSLCDAGLTELDGVSALPCLREFILSKNKVADLTPLCTHDALQVLDISDNKVHEMDALEILGTCPKLYSLDLRGNMLQKALSSFNSQSATNSKGYKEIINFHIPSLKVLDGNHIQFSLVDASVVAEAISYLSIYVDEHGIDDILNITSDLDTDLHEIAVLDPWQSPIGQKHTPKLPAHSKDSLDTSSSLTQTGLSFAGAPSALLRNRRGLTHPTIRSSSAPTLESFSASEVLQNVEEERRIELHQTDPSQGCLGKKSRRNKTRKPRNHEGVSALVSSSLDNLTPKQRNMSNQSPSPTDISSGLSRSVQDHVDGYEEEDDDGGYTGERPQRLIEAWRASRPCSSDDAIPKLRPLVTSSWELASPKSAASPNPNRSSRGDIAGGNLRVSFAPAMSLSFEADSMPTRPHSAHTSTPSTVPAFLMLQTSHGESSDDFEHGDEELEPSCDDIDISFKSAQKQFNGQRRTRKHRGRGWQNPLEFNHKLFVPPDVTPDTWGLDKAKGRLVPKYSKETIQEVDSESDSDEQVTRASLKARAQAIKVAEPVKSPSNSCTRSSRKSRILRMDTDSAEEDETGHVVGSDKRSERKASEEQVRPGSSGAAGQLGFDLQSSLQAIEKWTDVSELSTRRQRKLQESAENKQREAALLAKPSGLLSPKPPAASDVFPGVASSMGDVDLDVVRKSAVFRECSKDVGAGVGMPDEVLIDMLKQPPKHVPQLRTRDAFRSFFKGCKADRMRRLLQAACAEEKKVQKRYDLVADVLVE